MRAHTRARRHLAQIAGVLSLGMALTACELADPVDWDAIEVPLGPGIWRTPDGVRELRLFADGTGHATAVPWGAAAPRTCELGQSIWPGYSQRTLEGGISWEHAENLDSLVITRADGGESEWLTAAYGEGEDWSQLVWAVCKPDSDGWAVLLEWEGATE